MNHKKYSFKLDMVSVKLVKDASLMSTEKIDSPEVAVRLLGDMMCQLDREVVFVLNMNTAGMPINGTMASMGSINSSIMTPREIFKASILSNAAQIILLHNHPSGDLTPSREDIIATDTMIKAGAILGIPVTDHIIVGGDNSKFFSFREQKILNSSGINLTALLGELDFKQQSDNILNLREINNQYIKHSKSQLQARKPRPKNRDAGLER